MMLTMIAPPQLLDLHKGDNLKLVTDDIYFQGEVYGIIFCVNIVSAV